MRDLREFRAFLENLRMPGRRPSGVRHRPRVQPRVQKRQFTLGRVPRPEPSMQLNIPWRRVGYGLAGVLGIVFVLYSAAWLFTGDTFRVRTIDVHGAQVEDPRTIAFASGLGGSSLLTLDLDAAKRAIAELPGVKSVEVSRDWPHGVHIEVVEHEAWGYWQVANQVIEIDAEGRVLERARPAPEGAPTIIELAGPRDDAEGESDGESPVDADTVQLVARLFEDHAFDQVGVDALGFVFRRDRGLVVLTDGAPSTVFGDSSNYEFKVQAWRGLVKEIRNNGIEAQEIDLRFGRNVVLR